MIICEKCGRECDCGDNCQCTDCEWKQEEE